MLTEVKSHTVPRGMTRMTMLAGWNIPLWWFGVVLFLPVSLTLVNRNIFWLVLMVPLTVLARRASDDKDNNPRVTWLALTSGHTFADRSQDGVEKIHPLTPSDHCMDLLHD